MIIHVWRIQASVKSYSYVSVEADCRVEHSVKISERNAALWHFVNNEV